MQAALVPDNLTLENTFSAAILTLDPMRAILYLHPLGK